MVAVDCEIIQSRAVDYEITLRVAVEAALAVPPANHQVLAVTTDDCEIILRVVEEAALVVLPASRQVLAVAPQNERPALIRAFEGPLPMILMSNGLVKNCHLGAKVPMDPLE